MTDTKHEPLKAIAVDPPSLESADANGHYRVTLQLSRKVTRAEIQAVPAIAKNMRVYGSTLEISQTRVETVAATTKDIASILATAEEQGRKQDEHAALVARKQAEAEKARVEEEERLRKLAEGIKFD